MGSRTKLLASGSQPLASNSVPTTLFLGQLRELNGRDPCRPNPGNKTQIPKRLPIRRSQMPGDFLHLLLGGQPLVFIERALSHRKVNFALDEEGPAKDFFFRDAESGDDMTASAAAPQ
jgi:hypothetical protein